MSILVTGVLVNPLNQPIPNSSITLAAIDNSFTLLSGVSVTAPTNERGEYEFILEPSNYSVNVSMDGHHTFYGAITVTEITSPSSLNVLLKQNVMNAELPPNYTTFFQQIQMQVALVSNEAVQAKNLAVIKAAEAAQSAIDAKNAVYDVSLSSNELIKNAVFSGQALNGAIRILSRGQMVGYTIPDGQSGAQSHVAAMYELSDDDRSILTGKTLIFTATADASTDFLNSKPLSSTARMRVERLDGTYTITAGSLIDTIQNGTELTRTVSYVFDGTERFAGPVLQVQAAGISQNAAISQIKSLKIHAKSSGGMTASEIILAMKLNADRTKNNITQGNAESSRFSFSGQALYGASTIYEGGNLVGINIPQNVSGKTSYMRYNINFTQKEISENIGSKVRISLYLSTSDYFNLYKVLGTGAQAQLAITNTSGELRNVANTLIKSVMVDNGLFLREHEYTILGDEAKISPVIQIANSDASSNLAPMETFFKYYAIGYTYVNSDTPASTATDKQISTLINRRVTDALSNVGGNSFTDKIVDLNGSGDYLSIKSAIAAITDATASKQYRLYVRPGVYTDAEIHCKDFIHIIGTDRDTCIIYGVLPDSATGAEISGFNVIWNDTTTRIENMTVRVKNARYAIHSDSSDTIRNGTIEFINCHLEHLGNSAPANTWASQDAIGAGASSGQTMRVVGSTLVAPYAAFSIHNRPYFSKAARVELTNSDLICTADTVRGFRANMTINLESLGSFSDDEVIMNNCSGIGDIRLNNAAPWFPTALADQPADHRDWRVIGSGNYPAVFRMEEPGRALRITGPVNSTVSVSGSAVPVLFGRQVFPVYGSGGLPGYVYGWADISGTPVGQNKDVVITKLGQRLGDCRAETKNLAVTINNGVSVNILFDQNYTETDNVTVLSIINAALGSNAVASEFLSARYRPSILDEERTLLNSSSEGILMGMAVAYSGSNKAIRKMTNTDQGQIFAGIAWEDIYPGKFGRIKICGYLDIGDVLRSDGGELSYGDALSVGAVPGYLVKSESQSLIFAIRPDAVRVGNSKM